MQNISTKQKLIVMLAVMSGLFLVALDQTIIATALGAIVQEFGSYTSLGFVVTAYMLTTTVTVPLAGKFSDMYGRRKVLLTGVVIFTVGSLLSGLAPSMGWLIAWRALQGIGGGIITANAFTIVGDLFTPRERGKWQGLIGAVFGMSSVIGPLLGGWLTDGHTLLGLTTDWRWTFLINVPIGIVAGIVIMRYCPAIKHGGKHTPDYAGAALITVALSALVLAVDNTEVVFKTLIDSGLTLSFIKGTLAVIAILSAAAFVWVESRAKQPILPLSFFKNRTYSLMVMAALLFGAAFLGAILYLTQFNQQVYGATASSAGLMLLPMVGGMMISSITTGRLVSKFGRYKVFLMSGFAMAALSVLALITLQASSPYWHEAVIMFFAGLGLGMVMPILNLSVQNEFAQKNLGAATASVQLFRGLGSTIGTALLSGVLATGIASSIGNPSDISYIQTLKSSPQDAQVLEGEITADSLLRINMQKDIIRDGAEQGIARAPIPESAKKSQVDNFVQQQDSFSQQVVEAFTQSLHQVFMISSVLMVMAFALVFFVREKPLRDTKSTLTAE